MRPVRLPDQSRSQNPSWRCAAFGWRRLNEGYGGTRKKIALRVKQAVERFAETGACSVKKLQDIDPPEYRVRAGDYRARFELDGDIIRVLRVRNRREAYR